MQISAENRNLATTIDDPPDSEPTVSRCSNANVPTDQQTNGIQSLIHPATTPNNEETTVTESKNKTVKPNVNMYICDSFKNLHTNIQSVNGQHSSLQAIANTLDVDVVNINETNLKGKNKFHMAGYNCYTRNRNGGNMGGVASCVKDKYSNNTLKVSEGKKVEFIVTRH